MKQLRAMGVLSPLVFLLLLSLPARATVHQYVEDFTTKTYCDTLNTTASWDTLAGELRLPPFEVSLIGSYNTPGSAHAVAIAGNYAYVADGGAAGTGGFQVLDISDPTNPVSAGSYSTPDYAYSVAIAGDYAYVADRFSGLQVLDISDPTNPWFAGSCDTPGDAYVVALAGDYAYVADYDFGLRVVDISDPTNPVSAGSYDTPDHAFSVAIAGDYAYVADRSSGLQVVDISDPTNPVSAGSYDTPNQAFDVAIAGDYAYVADYEAGLQVVDISDPTNPVSAGSYDTSGFARGVAIAGDCAYVGDGYHGLQVVDISDPTNPVSAGSYNTPGYSLGVVIVGNHAYVADLNFGLQVLRISYPADPSFAGSYDTPGYAYGVALDGNYAYMADGSAGGFRVVDISDPTSPVSAGSYSTPGYALGVAIAGDYAYVADLGSGLQVLDISDPTNPSFAGSYDTPGSAYDVAIAGDYAYVADAGHGLRVVDISDPTNPVSAGSYSTPDDAYDVAIAGNYAYVADGYAGGLQVLDISDPTNPSFAGSYDTPSYAHGIALAGDYAYVADYDVGGLQVVDISDPTNPSFAGSYDTPGFAWGVALAGDCAYVADEDGGLQVLDISDPTNPSFVGSYDTPNLAFDVAIAGDYAYVADGMAGLQVLEVFQRALDLDANIGWSLDVEPTDDDVFWAKLSTTQSDSVTWELSADGGTNWMGVLPGGDLQAFAHPGSQLLWRSTHCWAGAGHPNPTCTVLTIDWLSSHPLVDSVVDIPDDQGRQVRVAWTRSGNDFVGSSTPITEYAVFRRIDDARASASESARSEFAARESRLTLADPRQSALYPPGSWDFIATVPADAEDEYAVVAPTLGDSTIASGMYYSVFFVRARTAEAGVYFDAPPDSGYSVDNLAPAVPQGLAVDYSASENELAWEECGDEDFQYFRVYRGTDSEFIPDPENLVHTTIGIEWIDSVTEGWQYHYKITALDFSGNESDAASPEAVTGIDPTGAPTRYVLHQNVPNPLNPTTVIRYDVPSDGGKVTLEVFDVSGRLVRRLVDGHEDPGRQSVVWDGRDERGSSVASGVYYYRLVAPGYEKTLKMMVVK